MHVDCVYRTIRKWILLSDFQNIFITFSKIDFFQYEKIILPWLVWLSGLSAGLQTKGSPVWFPVRAHAWVAGWVPSRGHMRGNHTMMFLSLSFPLPSLPSKNKQNLKKNKKKNPPLLSTCKATNIYHTPWVATLGLGSRLSSTSNKPNQPSSIRKTKGGVDVTDGG